MSTQGAIIEGLKLKRKSAETKLICEKKLSNFVKHKHSKHKIITKPKAKSIVEKGNKAEVKEDITAVIVYNNGDRYVGEVNGDIPHGNGTIVSASGEMFVGEWKDGSPHGRGHYLFADGNAFIGTWKNGERNGKGAFCVNGSVYDVEYDNGKLLNVSGGYA